MESVEKSGRNVGRSGERQGKAEKSHAQERREGTYLGGRTDGMCQKSGGWKLRQNTRYCMRSSDRKAHRLYIWAVCPMHTHTTALEG